MYNTVNKSECTKHVCLRALNDSSWNVATIYIPKHHIVYFGPIYVSMRVVGVKSTAGRAVKCVDPSKTTRSESAWLGYPFCDLYIIYFI